MNLINTITWHLVLISKNLNNLGLIKNKIYFNYVINKITMRLFGKAAKAPSVNESLEKLRDSIANLEKREAFLQAKHDREISEATKHVKNGRKREAIKCLKRKKIYSGQINQIENARSTIELQV